MTKFSVLLCEIPGCENLPFLNQSVRKAIPLGERYGFGMSEGAGGGLSPLFFTLICCVSVVVPPGVVTLTSSFDPVSSLQPTMPTPSPIRKAPANVVLTILRMIIASTIENNRRFPASHEARG
jgi:hypothetical protein